MVGMTARSFPDGIPWYSIVRKGPVHSNKKTSQALFQALKQEKAAPDPPGTAFLFEMLYCKIPHTLMVCSTLPPSTNRWNTEWI